MALVNITIRDEPDGGIDVTLNSEPSMDLTEKGELTDAQYIALGMLNSALEDADEDTVNIKATK